MSQHLKVTLYSGRKLNGTDIGGKCDPYVVLQLGNERYKSKKKKKTVNPDFNEVAYFPLNGDVADIHVEAFDYDFIGSDDSLGTGSASLADVLQGNETLFLVRLEGGDLGENIGKAMKQVTTDAKQNAASKAAKKTPGGSITGKLVDKASGKSSRKQHALAGARSNRGVIVMGVTICDGPAPSASGPLPKVTGRVFPTPGQRCTLAIEAIGAANVNAADLGERSDCYCQLSIQKKKVKTKVKKGTVNPRWDQTFSLPVPDAGVDFLYVKTKDADLIGTNDSLGVARVHLSELAVNERHVVALPLEGGDLGENVRMAASQASKDASSAASKKATSKLVGKRAGNIVGKVTADKNKKAGQHALKGARTNHGVVLLTLTLTPQ